MKVDRGQWHITVRMAVLLFVMLAAGCASVPKDYPRTESTAFTDYLDTSVGQLFEEAAM